MAVKKLILALLLFVPLISSGRMINVKRVSFPCKNPPVKLVEKMMDSLNIPFNALDQLNWEAFPYKPEVSFRIAYSNDEIYLQYKVREKYIRAFYTSDEGSAPYKDSCIEFFISLSDDDSFYYNLELNCIGVGTFAGGPDRRNRTRFDTSVISLIRRESSLGREGFGTKEGDFEWSITIAIPLRLFSLNSFEPLPGRYVRANFYKCGDDLPERHYLSWNPISTERPDFHRPDFFGTIYFEK